MITTLTNFLSASSTIEIVEVGESVTLAEDLGQVSSLSLNSSGEFLSLALENSEVWVLKLGWNHLEESSEKSTIKEVNHYATLEGHRSVVTGLHYIGKTVKTRLTTVSLIVDATNVG